MICRDCETVSHCMRKGCIPVEDSLYTPEEMESTTGLIAWICVIGLISACAFAYANWPLIVAALN